MKNSKSFLTLMTFAFVFACVMSCDDQDVKLKAKSEFDTKETITSANGRVGEVEFNGSEGGPLDLVTAKEWTSNFRSKSTSSDEVLAHYFGFEVIQKILDQSGCVGIRIYYALDDNGEKKLLLVGVDSKGENLLPLEGGRTDDDGDIVADYSWPCPDYCPAKGL
jgi:hypothetical protein